MIFCRESCILSGMMRRSIEKLLQHAWLQLAISILLMLYLVLEMESIIPISDASYCFMDAVLWSDALNAFHAGNINLAAKMDRPPLSLVFGSVLKHFGYSTPQALQLIAKLSFAGSVGFLFGGIWRFHSLPIACLSAYLLLYAPSYTKLSLWLNAQMFCNCIFVMHLVFGWILIKKRKPWSWLLLGLLASAGTLAKEQGLLLYPLTLLFCLGYSGTITQSLRQGFYFVIGSLPLGIWQFTWLRAQNNYGEKWRLFDEDLRLLFSRESWQDFLRIKTSWGSFAHRFYDEQDITQFFYKTADILLRELLPLSTLALYFSGALFLIGLIGRKIGDNGQFFWYLFHFLAIVPLLLIPIFEPYHYTAIAIGSVALLSWGLHTLWTIHPALSLMAIYWGFQAYPLWGKHPETTLRSEARGCIETRILPVREWARTNLERGASLYFTDTMVPWAKGYYPQTVKVLTASTALEEMSCTSDYVVMSELSNNRDYFKQYFDDEKGPHAPSWPRIGEINAVNKEVWWIYQKPCSEE